MGSAALALLLLATNASADPHALFIRAGWVFDGQGMRPNQLIVVREGAIADILDGSVRIPPDAALLDASDSTVMPGFIDAHLHFMGAPLWQSENVDRYGWGKVATEGYSLFPVHRSDLLRNGVTTICDMGSPLGSYQELRHALDDGRIRGPELYFPGPLFTAPRGHPAGTIYVGQHDLIAYGTIQVDDEETARAEVRRLAERRVDYVKLVYDRMSYQPDGAPRLRLEVARAIIDEAHRHGLKAFAHTGSEEEARAMVEAGVDGIEHGFGSTEAADTLFAEMRARHVAFTPTLSAFVHYAPRAVASMQRTVARAVAAGVVIAVGTDFPSSGGARCGDDLYQEMALLEAAGLSRLEVLRAATFGGATKIGKSDSIGSVAKGARANLVVYRGRVDEGPLSGERVERVILRGEPVMADGQVGERYRDGFSQRSRVVAPYFAWAPVTHFLLGVSATEFDLFGSNVSASGDFAYSFRNMWSASLQLAIPSPIPATRLKANLHFDDMNRLYYGLGNSTRGDGLEYAALVFHESVETRTRLARHWRLYGSATADQIWLSDYGGRRLPDVRGRDGERLVLLGLGVGYDTRDHENNPWRGLLLVAGGEAAPGPLGTGGPFERVSLDARGYASPFFKHIVAARVLYRQAFGAAPFLYLPEFGGPDVGRGFFPARYLDRVGLYGQLEYRFPIISIVSGVAFVDLGQVQASPDQLAAGAFHTAAGFGPRFAFGSNENSILAVDVGFSREGWALYVRPAHAF